jgi:hypothetical protein
MGLLDRPPKHPYQAYAQFEEDAQSHINQTDRFKPYPLSQTNQTYNAVIHLCLFMYGNRQSLT